MKKRSPERPQTGFVFCSEGSLYKMLSGGDGTGKIIMQKNTSLKKVELTY